MPRHLAHVIGARPNFIKAAPVIRALRERGVTQRIVHTGQHYDELMSDVFFRDLEIPTPDVNLGVGSGRTASRRRRAMVGLEREWTADPPALVVLYGDVNSTLAASLVAAKLRRPERARRSRPALVRPDDAGGDQPARQRPAGRPAFHDAPGGRGPPGASGVTGRADPLRRQPDDRHAARAPGAVRSGRRAGPARAAGDVRGRDAPPALERGRRRERPGGGRRARRRRRCCRSSSRCIRAGATLEAAGLRDGDRLRIVEPLGYVAFLSLVAGAAAVLTDSGGIQEETTILDVPCLTIRPNTERPITITHGTNRLVAPGEVVAARGRSWPARCGRAVHGRRCGTGTRASGSRTRSWTGWRFAPAGSAA